LSTRAVGANVANVTPRIERFNCRFVVLRFHDGNTYDRRVKVPPITVTCDCGEVRWLQYGDQWQCETCGRRWNTAQIPRDEYQVIERAVQRYKLQTIAFIAVMLAVFVPLMVLVDPRIGVTGLIIFFAWAFLLRPLRQRRLLATVRSASEWQLRPE
jgi:hypothetical protein